jgi:Ca2+/Na+ antiporter
LCTSRTDSWITVEDEDGRVGSLIGSAIFIVLLVYIGLTGLATLINMLVCIFRLFKQPAPFGFAVAAILFSCGLYWFGDFGMAIVTRNTIGTPSDRIKVLYYTYWVVERIPLFTF